MEARPPKRRGEINQALIQRIYSLNSQVPDSSTPFNLLHQSRSQQRRSDSAHTHLTFRFNSPSDVHLPLSLRLSTRSPFASASSAPEFEKQTSKQPCMQLRSGTNIDEIVLQSLPARNGARNGESPSQFPSLVMECIRNLFSKRRARSRPRAGARSRLSCAPEGKALSVESCENAEHQEQLPYSTARVVAELRLLLCVEGTARQCASYRR